MSTNFCRKVLWMLLPRIIKLKLIILKSVHKYKLLQKTIKFTLLERIVIFFKKANLERKGGIPCGCLELF